MTDFNKYDRSINPNWDPDALVEFRLFSENEGYRPRSVDSGFRPTYQIEEDYHTSTAHFFLEEKPVHSGEASLALVKFITPEVYPNTLFIGRTINITEGSRCIGTATVIEIYNDILRKDG